LQPTAPRRRDCAAARRLRATWHCSPRSLPPGQPAGEQESAADRDMLPEDGEVARRLRGGLVHHA
jgi:hypothetical protein